MNKERVIFVHGTYANDEKDDGHRWWQRHSVFWEMFGNTLPNHVSLVEDGHLFHWSGKNDALERAQAGWDLYQYLSSLDKEGVSYHVVAHSHGGSVLWEALRTAEWESRRKGASYSLPRLKSCIAIGAPFLIYRESSYSWNAAGLIELLLRAIGIGMPLAILFLLFTQYGYLSLLSLFLVFVTVPITENIYFPIGFQNRTKLDGNIVERHGKNWLSICSPDDEAINLLRSAIAIRDAPISLDPIKSRAVIERDFIDRVLFGGYSLTVYMYDKYITPIVIRIAKNRVSAFSLGMRFNLQVSRIEPWPMSELRRSQSISDTTIAKLKSNSEKYLSCAASSAHELLRAMAGGEVSNPLKLLSEHSEGGLVHTSYFDHQEIIDTVVSHIMSEE